jgi:hypothetical protein
MIVPLASDPLGFGWDLLGAAGRSVDVDAVAMGQVWVVAVAGVVLGHAAGVILAHRAALAASMRPVSQAPDGCLHAWGGESAAGMFADHDYYDPRTDSWVKLPDMPLPVHGVTGSAYIDGLIHAPGGGTEVGGSSGSLHNQVYRPAVSC